MKILLISLLVFITYKNYDISCILHNVNNKVGGSCAIRTEDNSISCHVTKDTALLPYKARYAVIDEKGNCVEIGLGWGGL